MIFKRSGRNVTYIGKFFALFVTLLMVGFTFVLPRSVAKATEVEPEVYDSPAFSEITSYYDEELNQTFYTSAGITHWEESTPGENSSGDAVPQMMSRMMPRAASTASIVTDVTVSPGSGIVGTVPGAEVPLLEIDFEVPNDAKAGDSHTFFVNFPWQFALGDPVEVKDAEGNHFATVTPNVIELDDAPITLYRSITVTWTDAVESHEGISGTIRTNLSFKSVRPATTVPIFILDEAGSVLGRSAGDWTVPYNDPAETAMWGNGGFWSNHAPGIAGAFSVEDSHMTPGKTYSVTFTGEDGTHPQCEGTLRRTIFSDPVDVDPDNPGEKASFMYYKSIPLQAKECSSLEGNTPGNVATFEFTKEDAAKTMTSENTGSFEHFIVSEIVNTPKPNTEYKVSIKVPDELKTKAGRTEFTGTFKSGSRPASEADDVALSTIKTAKVDSKFESAIVGSNIEYTITTTAAKGNYEDITNLVTTDKLPTGLEFVSATNGGKYNSQTHEVVWGPRTLVDGGSFTDTVITKVVDASAGSVTNVVTNTGDNACLGGDVISKCSDEVTTDVGNLDFEFTKSSVIEDTNNNGFIGDLGDTIVYSFKATNTGDITITTAKFSDAKLGISDRECLTGPLAPGQSVDCEGRFTHVITEADVAAGSVTNDATLCVGEECKPGTDEKSTIDPGFEFTKHSQVIQAEENRGFDGTMAGDTIQYWFTVTNTGNVDLKDLTVTDDLLGLNDAECVGLLEVGATDVRCVTEGTYVVTEADEEAGQVVNHAFGSVPGLPDVPGIETEEIVSPSFNMVKHSEVTQSEENRGFEGIIAGDTISYWFTVSNTGNVPLRDVAITDELLGLDGAACVSELAVGATDVRCEVEADYVITAADQEAGSVTNHALATVPGLPDEPGETTEELVDPSVGFDKQASVVDANKDGVMGNVGDFIYYNFVVTNTGNVPLTSALLNDDFLGVSDHECLSEPLAVGASVDCIHNEKFSHMITRADDAKGEVVNVATLTVPGLPSVEDTEIVKLGVSKVPSNFDVLAATGSKGIIALGIFGATLIGAGSFMLIRHKKNITE